MASSGFLGSCGRASRGIVVLGGEDTLVGNATDDALRDQDHRTP